MATFATLDTTHSNKIDVAADIREFADRAAAEAWLASSYNELEDGERLVFEYGEFPDCWFIERRRPEEDAVFGPFSGEGLIIQVPGYHPGGNVYWVTPRAGILTVQVLS